MGRSQPFIARQYYEHDRTLLEGSNLWECCEYLKAALISAPDRRVQLFAPRLAPVLVYTDASLEAGKARIGALVKIPEGPVLVMSKDIEGDLRMMCGDSDHFISQAELLAAPLLVHSMPTQLAGRDIIWFIDNRAAETALVKAGSPSESMCRIALLATASFAAIKARPWFDHIASDDNVYADRLSRGGFDDPLVSAFLSAGLWTKVEAVEPTWVSLSYSDLFEAHLV